MADLPQEADEQHENPVRPESHPYMAGGENQVRELRVRPYEYLQSLRQTVPPLYETAGQQKLSRLWENHHGGTGSGSVSVECWDRREAFIKRYKNTMMSYLIMIKINEQMILSAQLTVV